MREKKSGCFPKILLIIIVLVAIGYFSKRIGFDNSRKPERDENFYVTGDSSSVSEATKKLVSDSNKKFEADYGGAQYVFLIKDTLGGEDIKSFTRNYLKEHQIGSSENDNGMLIVLAINEKEYYTDYGKGLDNALAGKMAVLLYKYLEPDFLADNIDLAITNSIPHIETVFKNSCSKWANTN